MSTIQEVRAAEKKVQEVLESLKGADANDSERLCRELQNVTDQYAKAVRDLN